MITTLNSRHRVQRKGAAATLQCITIKQPSDQRGGAEILVYPPLMHCCWPWQPHLMMPLLLGDSYVPGFVIVESLHSLYFLMLPWWQSEESQIGYFFLESKLIVLHKTVPCGSVVCWYMFKSWMLDAH